MIWLDYFLQLFVQALAWSSAVSIVAAAWVLGVVAAFRLWFALRGPLIRKGQGR